jgi:hypothetical protein
MRDDHPVALFSRRAPDPDSGEAERATLCAYLARKLREDLADPVQLDARGRDRCTLMRGVEVRVNRRKRAITVRGRRSAWPHDWLYGTLKLDRPLSGPDWARAWWWCVREELPGDLRALGDEWLAAGLPAWINREARHTRLLRSARRKSIAALRLNPRLLARARALSHNGTPNSDHYVTVWRDAHASKTRMREAPLLWPLYDVTGVPLRFDLDVVKRRLVNGGLTRGGWIALCRHGRALWWPIRRCHEFGRNPKREIIAMANLLGPLGPVLPPPALRLAVGRLSSINRFPASDAGKLLLPFRAAWRHLETLAAHERAAYVRGPVDAVLTEWMLQSELPVVPRGAGWQWFEGWAERNRRASRDQRVRWPSFGNRRRIGDLEIVPLRNLRAVREAGLALRNCMGRAEEQDIERSPALFLAREVRGRTLAMFSSYAEDGGALLEIRGRYNRSADAYLRGIVSLYLHAACKAGVRRSSRRRQ